MKKTKTISERAADYLKANKNVPEVFATSDEFLFTKKDLAKSHAKGLNDKKLKTFKREPEASDDSQKSEFLDQPIKAIKAALPEKKDVAELEAYLAEEKAQEDPRTGAIEALEAAIEELTKDKD